MFGPNESQWNYLQYPFMPLPLPSQFPPNYFDELMPVKQEPPQEQQPSQSKGQGSKQNEQECKVEEMVKVEQIESPLLQEKNNLKKKVFKKDKHCPVNNCKKKYSSRIALRAHLRKVHSQWMKQTSDYEP